LSLLHGILTRARQTLDLAKTRYENPTADIATVLSAQREVLQVAIQIAQVEAELGKALASLERAVGCQVNERPLDPTPAEEGAETPGPPPAGSSPFRPGASHAGPAPGRDSPSKPRPREAASREEDCSIDLPRPEVDGETRLAGWRHG